MTIESSLLQDHEAIGHGGAIALWARTQHSVLGAARVAERGVPAETLGESAASDLLADLKGEASLDMYAADQMLVYAALAGPGSAFTARAISLHARTAMWLIEHFPSGSVPHQRNGSPETYRGDFEWCISLMCVNIDAFGKKTIVMRPARCVRTSAGNGFFLPASRLVIVACGPSYGGARISPSA